MPTINRSGDNDLLRIANDSDVTINGINLQGGRPIRVENAMNVMISNVTVNSSAANRSAALVENNSSVTFNDLTINSASRQGINIRTGSTVNFNNAIIRNTDRDGILVTDSIISLNNSTIRDIGDGGVNDDAIQVQNSTLSGLGNSIEGNIDGQDCRDLGENTGSIGFTSGPITSCP